MPVLVTGANGFLGNYLVAALLKKQISVIATGTGNCRLPFTSDSHFQYATMDFTDPDAVAVAFEKYKPAVVVHAGAMSKPDECEQKQERAWTINVQGTANLLQATANCQSRFVFVSTDFVFDGKEGMYREDAVPAPVNYYGLTKLEAEKLVQAYGGDWAIVRTVLVYGHPMSGRSNILSIVQSKLMAGEAYKVVSDQVRTPTYVEDLANGIVAIIEKNKRGIWHLSGEEVLSPFEMACKAADFLSLDKTLLEAVTTSSFVQPALRPLKTGFDITKAKRELGYQPVSFSEGLEKTFG